MVGDMYKTTPGAVNVSKALGLQDKKPEKPPIYDRDVFM